MYDVVTEENGIVYGILYGSRRLFFIKAGNSGGIYGYENKYLRMAEKINSEYGFSVLAASDPFEVTAKENMEADCRFVKKRFSDVNEIYAFGHSKGGQMLAAYAWMDPKIKRVLTVNAPLMLNFHKIKAGIERFEGEKITMVYGEHDPSFPYIDFLKNCGSSKLDLHIIQNADHHFTNRLERFLALPAKYLF